MIQLTNKGIQEWGRGGSWKEAHARQRWGQTWKSRSGAPTLEEPSEETQSARLPRRPTRVCLEPASSQQSRQEGLEGRGKVRLRAHLRNPILP